MNTLFLTGSVSRDGGGLFTALQGLVPALGERQIHVTLHGVRDACWDLDAESWHTTDVHAHAVSGPASFGYSPSMRRAAMQSSADLVHTHGLWMYASTLAQRVQRNKRIPLVVSPHGMLNEQALKVATIKKTIALAAYERKHVMDAQCLHALVDTELDAIRQFGYRGPVCVIPNGVPKAEARPLQAAPWQQLSLGIEPEAPVLLYLGRKHPIKNLDTLIDAWQILEQQQATGRWHLVVAGWGEHADEAALSEQIRQRRLQSAHLLGPLFGSDKVAALHECAGFVLVSHGEALPMAVLEAWAYAVPALLSRQCNFPEAYEINAALPAATKPQALAQSLRQFIETPLNELQRMGNNGRQLVQQRYTWAGVSDQFHTVYHWLQHGGSRPDCIDPSMQ